MILVENQNGHQLLSFVPSKTPIPSSEEKHIPIPFALVVAFHQGKALLIHNQWRQVWELPGGMIDEGETPELAAKRELEEETSQIADELEFIGLAKVRLKPDDRLEFGAIYTCELNTIQPFQTNDEASQILWWDLNTPIDGHITAIDHKIIEMTNTFLSTAKDLAKWNEKAESYSSEIGTDTDRTWTQFQGAIWDCLGDLTGKSVLDLACGHGWLANKIKENGATVLGIDGSSELLKIAHDKYPSIDFIEYDLSAGLPSLDHQFHYILANMVLMDIPELTLLMSDIRSNIEPTGRFIFTITHPAFFFQKTGHDKESNSYYKKVRGYLEEQVWDVGHTHYHRSLTYYFDLLRDNDFAVTRLYEPEHIPLQYEDEKLERFYRDIPVFILIEAMPITR